MRQTLFVATAEVFKEQLVDVNHKRYPRVDYIELERVLDAETMDYSLYARHVSGKFLRYLETQLRSDIYLATMSWLKGGKYPLVFAWSERAGIPLAGYKRLLPSTSRFVTLFACWSKRQELVITKLGLFSVMDKIIVQCSSMRRQLISLGAHPGKVEVIHHGIDQAFFSPLHQGEQLRGMIMSVGEPRSRDYASLFRAVAGLPLSLNVPAYGHWYAREKNKSLAMRIPENVSVMRHLSQMELRDLYGRCQFVVLPIRDLVYSAGATASLEAGSMARAVIAFRSEGITDYIIDGETGILVEPGDVRALVDAIQFLLSHPAEARRLGDNARERILKELSFETYVTNIADVLMQH